MGLLLIHVVLTKSGCDSYGRDSYSCPCDEIASLRAVVGVPLRLRRVP